MLRIRARTTPEDVLKQLSKACQPWERAATYKKDVFLLKARGSRLFQVQSVNTGFGVFHLGTRFTLTKNGSRGRTRPQRVFRGRVRRSGDSTLLTGRFGMTTADRLLVYLPSQFLLLLAAILSFTLAPMYAAVLWGACLLCSAVLIGFFTVLDRSLGAEPQKEMTELINQLGDKE
ncbi:MAG: hypothetical protein LBR72_09325 [Oscillospiraceae bacterium]|jgi:hypothetical protein|nr:hypothetical protein [Oscillospiraceae bacterium]